TGSGRGWRNLDAAAVRSSQQRRVRIPASPPFEQPPSQADRAPDRESDTVRRSPQSRSVTPPDLYDRSATTSSAASRLHPSLHPRASSSTHRAYPPDEAPWRPSP